MANSIMVNLIPAVNSIMVNLIPAVSAIFVSLAYYKLISGFLSDVTIRRLTKTTLDLSLIGFLDLFFGYTFGISAFVIIYFYKISVDPLFEINNVLFISSGFGLLYIGRILTKQQGSIFGKLHFSSLFITVFAIILVQIVSTADLNFEKIYSVIENFTYIFDNNKTHILFGSLLLATLGEFILSCLPPTPKSLLSVSDKFPSDFKVICGVHPLFRQKYNLIKDIIKRSPGSFSELGDRSAIRAKLKDIFEDQTIVEAKCVSKTLMLAEDLARFIQYHHKNGRKIKCKILFAPPEKAIDDYVRGLNRRPISIGIIIKSLFDKNNTLDKYNRFVSNYVRRSNDLKKNIRIIMTYSWQKAILVILYL